MGPPTAGEPVTADKAPKGSRRWRSGHRFPRGAVRRALRDPLHIPERLAIESQDRHAEGARSWAEKARAAEPDASPAVLADAQRHELLAAATIDGAVAGTPFFIALVPAYVEYLSQEARMYLRVAALYGHDPADPRLAAEFLVLRGVQKNEEEALKTVEYVRNTPVSPREGRLPVKSWYHAVLSVLILAGFISPGDSKAPKSGWRAQVWRIVHFTTTALVWALTWIVPVTFMILMAWSCESDARTLSQKVIAQFEHPGDDRAVAAAVAQRKAERHLAGTIARSALVLVSVAIPLALVAGAVQHGGLLGLHPPAIVGSLAGLALVIVVGTLVYMRLG